MRTGDAVLVKPIHLLEKVGVVRAVDSHMDDVIIRTVVALRSPTHATRQRASPFVVMKTAPQAVVKHLWPDPPQVHNMLDSIRTVSTIIHTTMSNTGDYHNIAITR